MFSYSVSNAEWTLCPLFKEGPPVVHYCWQYFFYEIASVPFNYMLRLLKVGHLWRIATYVSDADNTLQDTCMIFSGRSAVCCFSRYLQVTSSVTRTEERAAQSAQLLGCGLKK